MRQGQLASATGEKRTSPSLGGLLGVIFDFQSFTDEVSVGSQHDRVNHSFVTCIGHKWNTSIGGPMVATGGPPRDAQLQELDSILDIFHECFLHGYTSVQKSDVARSVESPVLSCAMCFHRCRRLRCLFCLVACRQTFFSLIECGPIGLIFGLVQYSPRFLSYYLVVSMAFFPNTVRASPRSKNATLFFVSNWTRNHSSCALFPMLLFYGIYSTSNTSCFPLYCSCESCCRDPHKRFYCFMVVTCVTQVSNSSFARSKTLGIISDIGSKGVVAVDVPQITW